MADMSGWSSVPNWVIRTDKLHGTEKWVYITLLNRSNAKGECWPSLSTLQKEVGVSKNTILKTLQSLEDKGLIKRVRRRVNGVENASNLYRIFVWEGGSISEPGGSNENQGVVQPLNQGGSNESQEVLPTEVLPNRSTTQGGGDDSPPSIFCKRHEASEGTDYACRACRAAAERYDEWKAARVVSKLPKRFNDESCDAAGIEHRWLGDGTCVGCTERREVA